MISATVLITHEPSSALAQAEKTVEIFGSMVFDLARQSQAVGRISLG